MSSILDQVTSRPAQQCAISRERAALLNERRQGQPLVAGAGA